MIKSVKLILSDDDIRTLILKYFYDIWKNTRGMSSFKLPISKITADLKTKGVERKEVVRNLSYLIDNRWINELVEESQFFTGKQRIQTKKTSYKISSDGIDYFDGSSKFQKPNKNAGIKIENVTGIVSIGDNNYIQGNYIGLFNILEDLDRYIRMSNLTDEEKLNYQAEIGTIQNQLKKNQPNVNIIKLAWNSLEKVSTVAGAIDFIEKIRPLIQKIIGL